MNITGITSVIGAEQLLQAGTLTTTVSMPGATVGMTVSVTPEIYPGAGIFWEGFVSAPDQVTVKVSTVLAGEIVSTRYFVLASDGSGGDGFPAIVGAVTRVNESASFSVDLVATPNGDYELNDYAIVVTDDPGANVTYQVSWTDEAGPVVIGPINVSLGTGQSSRFSITGLTLLNSGISLIPELTPPTTIHAVPATPITAAFIVSGATTLQVNYRATVTQNA